MGTIRFDGKSIPVPSGKTVLDILLHNGHEVPNSCRAGACQSCLMQATEGSVPAQAQVGLKDTMRAQGYFLACRCQPDGDMAIRLPEPNDVRIRATVVALEGVAEDVMRLRLQPKEPFAYRAGQYVTLWRDETLGRSYSLASVPGVDKDLEFHVKIIPGGRFSDWARKTLRRGDRLMLQGPTGNTFYTTESQDQQLLLIGTGTGLAPLYGIVRDALHAGHRESIHLVHGALDASGLYLGDELRALAKERDNFHYHPSVLQTNGSHPTGVTVGPVDGLAMETVPDPAGSKVYICGDPVLVNRLRKRIFLAGASIGDIHADAFLPSVDTKRAA